jgi:hypothetical protein
MAFGSRRGSIHCDLAKSVSLMLKGGTNGGHSVHRKVNQYPMPSGEVV